MDRAVEALRLGEIPCRTQQHRGVTVMAAGVHHAVVARAMGEFVLFVDRKCIHVGAQADGAGAGAGLEPADHAGRGEAAMHLDAVGLEFTRHDVRGAGLLEAELGVGVDVAADFGQIVMIGRDARDDGHGLLLVFAPDKIPRETKIQPAARPRKPVAERGKAGFSAASRNFRPFGPPAYAALAM